ncbi:hypothetical protein V8G54_004155 [Vigna mungo]|uniref:CAAX prenyl protease 2/Lysostaphin resistance protein A-like domain-containing protein n=1 Tax=Vigna mungo TaxID=3915 RepID=A0AAQ3PD05_VIGMU
MLSTSSYSAFSRTFLPIKGFPRPVALRPFPRILESHAKSPRNRLSIQCFRHDHLSPETPQPEVIEHYFHEDLVQSEFSDSSVVTKRDWKSSLQKLAVLCRSVQTILSRLASSVLSRWVQQSCPPVLIRPTARFASPHTIPATLRYDSFLKLQVFDNFLDQVLDSCSCDVTGDRFERLIFESRIDSGSNASVVEQAANEVFKVIGYPWVVPWTAMTILQVMLLWTTAFWFIGSWMIPFAAHITGFSKESLTFRGQALFSLVTDVTEGLAGVAILLRCLSRFRPLPPDWFRFSLKGNWQLDVIMGCLMFPLVNRLSQFNLDLLPLLPSTPVTLSSVEQSIRARDPVAMLLYATVVSVCAPVWEEIVFRGFLLPSLTKYMPVWCAILVSSIAFALAHFNIQRMLPLIFLGMVMGVIYTRSRNLLPPMLLHSLWNGFVFLDLMK